MSELLQLIENVENEIIKIVVSSPFYKTEIYKKIVIEKKDNYYLVSKYYDTKVSHENIKDNFENKIFNLLEGYKNINIFTLNEDISILTNKKGAINIKRVPQKQAISISKTHNREKNYILKEGEKIDFLIYLKVMNKDGIVFSQYMKKFKQINKFLEIIKEIEDKISHNANILDVGSGKSYLTFAIYYYFNVIQNKNVNIIGLDLKKDVVEDCNKIANELGYTNLTFKVQDVTKYKPDIDFDLVVSLHACDIATDYSIFTGISLKSKVILASPCCQHELAKKIKSDTMSSVLKHGILKERVSAIITDAIRAELMEMNGYNTTVMEFIEVNDTPKNLVIKGIYTGKCKSNKDYEELKNSFNASLTLEELLNNNIKKGL